MMVTNIDVIGDDYDTAQVESEPEAPDASSASPLWGYWSVCRMRSEYIMAWSVMAPYRALKSCLVRSVATGSPPRLMGAGECGPNQV